MHTSLNVKYGQPGYSLVAGVGGWGWGGGGFLLFRMNERLVDWRADRLDESPTYILRPKPATALIQQP